VIKIEKEFSYGIIAIVAIVAIVALLNLSFSNVTTTTESNLGTENLVGEAFKFWKCKTDDNCRGDSICFKGKCINTYFVMSEGGENCDDACGDNICVGNLGQSWDDDFECNIMKGNSGDCFNCGGDCSNCQKAGPSVPWSPGWQGGGGGAGSTCFYKSEPTSDCETIGGEYGPYQRLCKCLGWAFVEFFRNKI